MCCTLQQVTGVHCRVEDTRAYQRNQLSYEFVTETAKSVVKAWRFQSRRNSMSIGRLAIALLASGFAVSMTDWFFGGVLFHERYLAYPEVWRRRAGQPGEGQAIAWAILLGFVTCVIFI